MMEVFAGFLSHTDDQLGRLLDFLERDGQLENTIVMVISDNGASAEGGPTGTTNEAQFFNNAQGPLEDSLKVIDEIGGPKHFNHYPWGWTWAGNTPFRRWKRETYRGGISDPFIVHWPKSIKSQGEVRTQYAHAIDMVPTVLDLLGIQPPTAIRGITQSPLHGVSLASHLRGREGRERPEHAVLRDARAPLDLQGRLACGLSVARAVVHRGGRRVRPADLGRGAHPARHDGLGALPRGRRLRGKPQRRRREPGQADRADRHLVRRGGKVQRVAHRRKRSGTAVGEKPLIAAPRNQYVYRPGTQPVPFFAGPRVLNRPHSITAEVEIPEGGAEGVLLSQGSSAGGYSFYVQGGKLHYVHNYLSRGLYSVHSEDDLPAGKHELRFEFEPTGEPDMAAGKGAPGRLQLYIDGKLAGNAEAPVTVPFAINPGALACGSNPGSAVTPEYTSPFAFTGTIKQVTVDISGELIKDDEAELRAALSRQ